MTHTFRCPDSRWTAVETIIAPPYRDQNVVGTAPTPPVSALFAASRLQALMIAHNEATPIFIALAANDTKRIFLVVRPGVTRIFLTEDAHDVLFPAGMNAAALVWQEDLPAVLTDGPAP